MRSRTSDEANWDGASAPPEAKWGRASALRRLAIPLALAAIACAVPLDAHDLFLRPRGFWIAPGATIVIPVFNGTFSRSENAVTPDRIATLTMAGPGGRRAIAREAWSGRDPQSTLRVTVGDPGTHAVGAYVAPRDLELDGKAFEAYLAEEGLDVVIAARKRQGRSGQRARERYAKAVKTLLAVTDARGRVVAAPGGAGTVATEPLGLPAEIVPLADPYASKVGDALRVRATIDGTPLAGWVLIAGGRVGTSDVRIPAQRVTTDRDGVATIRLTHDGHWFVKFVHMREAATPGLDYESRWATLTFGLQP